ncbi:MAG TPA: hypothetical protein VNV38_20765 [Stellaceae bacterium]|jgi:hypothetical protein|nr:hypothetical protein [Stellaceae bacterium]
MRIIVYHHRYSFCRHLVPENRPDESEIDGYSLSSYARRSQPKNILASTHAFCAELLGVAPCDFNATDAT